MLAKTAISSRTCWHDHSRRHFRGASVTLITLLATWLAALCPGRAMAQHDESFDGFWGGGIGPTWSWGSGGHAVGWEMSVTSGSPLAHFSFGGEYRGQGDAQGGAHYLAWEPGLVGGASLGLSVNERRFRDGDRQRSRMTTHAMFGVWGGLPLPLAVDSEPVHPGSDYSVLTGVWVSFAFGYRYMGGEHAFYIAPKLNYYEVPNPNS